MSDHQQSRKIDPFLLSYTADELLIASEFLSNWLPFLSRGLCQSCTLTLSRCIRSLDLGASGDAERLKQQEDFAVLTPELSDSNYCSRNLDNCVDNKECADSYDTADTTSLGSWKDGAECLKQQGNFTVLTPELPDLSDCNGNLHNCVNHSPGSRKECADLYDTADTNSLGSWKEGTDGAEHLKQQEKFTIFTPELPNSND